MWNHATDHGRATGALKVPHARGRGAMTRPLRENLFRTDPAEQGRQAEVYALHDMSGPEAPAWIPDFDPKTDALHLQLLDGALFGLAPGDWPVATLAHDPGSNTTAVAVNGVIVALIDGNPGLDPADISVIALV